MWTRSLFFVSHVLLPYTWLHRGIGSQWPSVFKHTCNIQYIKWAENACKAWHLSVWTGTVARLNSHIAIAYMIRSHGLAVRCSSLHLAEKWKVDGMESNFSSAFTTFFWMQPTLSCWHVDYGTYHVVSFWKVQQCMHGSRFFRPGTNRVMWFCNGSICYTAEVYATWVRSDSFPVML